MIRQHRANKKFVLMTGSTGFIGHYVLAELLRRGRRCVVLLREPLYRSESRLRNLLAALGVDLDAEVARECLIVARGDLGQGFDWPRVPIEAVVHLAAATRFSADPATGDPWSTNVEGTRRLLEWMCEAGDVANFHLVSSAYVCGKATSPVGEHVDPRPRPFHNEYEESKWMAELACAQWQASAPNRRTLTVFRPSIVVGDQHTGRSTRFNGFYLMARATELLHRSLAGADQAARHSIALRIKGRPDDCQNIVPVDYVAGAIAGVLATRQHQGTVYHLTHPNPPTNQQIKHAMEQHFDLGGGRFTDPEAFDSRNLNDWERSFYDVSKPIEHYFIDTPTFHRSNASKLDRTFSLSCPGFTCDGLARLVRYAQLTHWGRRPDSADAASDRTAPLCAAYFEKFLPRCIAASRVAGISALSVTVRFIISDEENGQWVCRFERGKLTTVHRGSNSMVEDFAYRSNRDVFWRAIAGRTHPQELFLGGEVDISGNIELALKMAMILHAFIQEFPCNRRSLMNEMRIEHDRRPAPDATN